MSSIFLIGMPGAGKSTLGVQLAKFRAQRFIDTDLLIQEHVGASLQQICDQQGYLKLREYEEHILLSANFDNAVVATGGSVVYSEMGMQRLASIGPRLYLQISLSTMRQRIGTAANRGLAQAPGTSFDSLYHERSPLYEKWATARLELDSLSPHEAICALQGVEL
jgi:shikimate kinase